MKTTIFAAVTGQNYFLKHITRLYLSLTNWLLHLLHVGHSLFSPQTYSIYIALWLFVFLHIKVDNIWSLKEPGAKANLYVLNILTWSHKAGHDVDAAVVSLLTLSLFLARVAETKHDTLLLWTSLNLNQKEKQVTENSNVCISVQNAPNSLYRLG